MSGTSNYLPTWVLCGANPHSGTWSFSLRNGGLIRHTRKLLKIYWQKLLMGFGRLKRGWIKEEGSKGDRAGIIPPGKDAWAWNRFAGPLISGKPKWQGTRLSMPFLFFRLQRAGEPVPCPSILDGWDYPCPASSGSILFNPAPFQSLEAH